MLAEDTADEKDELRRMISRLSRLMSSMFYFDDIGEERCVEHIRSPPISSVCAPAAIRRHLHELRNFCRRGSRSGRGSGHGRDHAWTACGKTASGDACSRVCGGESCKECGGGFGGGRSGVVAFGAA
eukprot:IDg3568t1